MHQVVKEFKRGAEVPADAIFINSREYKSSGVYFDAFLVRVYSDEPGQITSWGLEKTPGAKPFKFKIPSFFKNKSSTEDEITAIQLVQMVQICDEFSVSVDSSNNTNIGSTCSL